MTETLIEKPDSKLVVFDTTLRDGAQMPGISFNYEDRLAIAMELAQVGVDVLEAGFPSSSEQNFEAVKAIAETVEGPVICAFSGTQEEAIEKTWEAIEPAQHRNGARLNVCLPVSDLHIYKRLQTTPDQALEMAVAAVRKARSFTDDVEFSAEDASRANPEYLKRVVLAVAGAGATTLMIPDTVGKAVPDEYAGLTGRVRGDLDAHGFGNVVVAAHCHNDMGLAAANTLAALTRGGAGQVDVTGGGIGERAGNASLEQIAAIAHERPELDILTRIDTTRLTQLVHDIAHRGGVHLQYHLPVVGKNSFRHASGWHQHGMTKDRRTFEHMRAEDYGQEPGQFLISDQSGRAGIKSKLESLAIFSKPEHLLELRKLAENFVQQKGRFLLDADLEELNAELTGESLVDEFHLDLDELVEQTVKGVSTVTVVVNGAEATASSAKGPVDAAKLAINHALGIDGNIERWDAGAPQPDSGSTVGVFATVRLDDKEVNVHAHERSSDFASIAAYMKGLNIIRRIQQRTEAEEQVSEQVSVPA